MKTSGKKAAWVGVWLVVSACQTPGARGARSLSAVEHSGAFASDSGDSNSDSGNSDSGNSDSGDSDSGDSDSDSGSGNSSDESGDSSEYSGETSDDTSDNSRTDSNETSRDSTDDSSGSSDSSESSEKNPAATATVIGLTAAGLGAVIWQVIAHSVRAAPPPAAAPAEVARAAQTYLRSRSHQLREDLALGAGPTVEDLAALARIRREHLGIFGRLLRAHRHELLAMADARTLTPERAAAWLRRVGELARTDPRLEADGRAFLATYGAQEPRP
jgi:hypothetical protein